MAAFTRATKLDAPTRRRRLYAFLARKGYDSERMRTAMQRVLDADEAADAHLAAALPHLFSGDYVGEHWVSTFALLALTG